MKDFRKGGKKRFGGHGGGFGGDRDRGSVTMHQATCAKCQKSCEVPFQPDGTRPVYCSSCFEGKRETGDNRGGDRGRERFPKKNYDGFKTSPRPDFRNDSGRGNTDEVKKQLELLNEKMDRLIRTIEAIADIKSAAEEKAVPAGKAKNTIAKVSKK